MRMWLQRFFYGRNGVDQLSIGLFVLGMILSIPARITGWLILWAVYYVCIFLFFFRTLSRNLYKRRQENQMFTTRLYKIGAWFKLRWRMLRELPAYKYLKCPDCGQRLRLPRGKGQVNVSCSRCRTQFRQKT